MATQCDRILQYMHDFGSINPVQAMSDLGVMRLGARIWDLKKGRPSHHPENGQEKEPIRRAGELCRVQTGGVNLC